MSPIHVEILHSFRAAEPRWRHYQERGDAFVYQTADWVMRWHEHIGRHRDIVPCLVDIMDTDGTPLAFLPFGVEKRLLGSALIWLGGDIADYHGPIITTEGARRLDEAALDHLWTVLRRDVPGLAYADFSRQPALIGDLRNPFAEVGRRALSQIALSTRLTDDWPGYYAAKRGKKTRHNDRRKRRKLESEGNLAFVVATTPEEIETQIAVMLEQKDRYVARLGQTNSLRQRGHADFLKAMTADRMADQTTLLCALKLDGQILAVQWGILHRRRLFSVIASYDDGPLSRFSTGDILLRELFAWCFDNDVEVVDFTCGGEPYKRAWCDQSLDLEDRLLPLTLSGHAAVAMNLAMATMRRWAKASPALRGAVAGLRSRTRSAIPPVPPTSSDTSVQQGDVKAA